MIEVIVFLAIFFMFGSYILSFILIIAGFIHDNFTNTKGKRNKDND